MKAQYFDSADSVESRPSDRADSLMTPDKCAPPASGACRPTRVAKRCLDLIAKYQRNKTGRRSGLNGRHLACDPLSMHGRNTMSGSLPRYLV